MYMCTYATYIHWIAPLFILYCSTEGEGKGEVKREGEGITIVQQEVKQQLA